MTDNILLIENLVKDFKKRKGTKRVLDNLSFFVRSGSIVGFVGPNGAGKTTTIKSVLDLIRPTSGQIHIFGKDNFQKEVKSKIGYMPEKDVFYEEMYPLEYLVYLGTLSGMDKEEAKEISLEWMKTMGIDTALDTKIKNFSSGMKKKIFFIQAVLHDPSLIILDEPTANLDPLAQEQLLFFMKSLAQRGSTILVSSHNIEELEKIVDYVVVINRGKLILDSPLEKLREESNKGIEVNVNNSALAAQILLNYRTQIIDKDTLIVDALPNEKNNILKLLIEYGLEIRSISTRKQSLWNIILEILKENE
jgi:ABC-2 type transport system ATP-binding protein